MHADMRSDVPFLFKAHHVNASISSYRRICGDDNIRPPPQPHSTTWVPQTATM